MAQSMLIYGVTGSFKTSNAAEYVKWLYDRYGGTVRGVFGDNYGPLRAEVESGLLDAWDLTTEPDPLACLILASEGWWPEKLEGGIVQDVGARKKPIVKNNFTGISGYLIEGFKENADLIHRMMERKRQATGEPLAGEHTATAYGQAVQYAVSSRGTYQFGQSQTHRYFKLGFKGLPVPWIMATSHEYANRKAGIYGVAVTGQALAKSCPQWFDHTLHFEKTTTEQAVIVPGSKTPVKVLRDGSRAWFAAHSIDNIRWPAKLGVEPYLMEHVYQTWPHGYVPLVMTGSGPEWEYTSSIRNLLELIDPVPAQQLPE